MRIVDCQQGTQEWFDARCGLPTASGVSAVVDSEGNLKQPRAKAAKDAGELSEATKTYIDELLGEPYIERDVEKFHVSSAMQYGIDTEVRARLLYDLRASPPSLREAGFCIHDSGLFGASPDALIYDDIGSKANLIGGLELKCPSTAKHVRYLREGELPEEYKAQVHTCMIVTGARWWDFMSFHEKIEPLYLRIYPNEYTANLEKSLFKFAEILAVEKAKFEAIASPE